MENTTNAKVLRARLMNQPEDFKRLGINPEKVAERTFTALAVGIFHSRRFTAHTAPQKNSVPSGIRRL